MSMIAVELMRLHLGLARKALCLTAKVHPTTYARMLKRPGAGRLATLQRLTAAIEAHRMTAQPPAAPAAPAPSIEPATKESLHA